jgi:hypothetical protein
VTEPAARSSPIMRLPMEIKPDLKAALDKLAQEAKDRKQRYLDSFEKALPGMPISDELKAGFSKVIKKQR